MPATPIGFKPYSLNVLLVTADADFNATIRTSDGTPFADGAEISLKFSTDPATIWPATISEDTATWNVDKTDVAALVPGTSLAAHILYSDPSGADLVWFSGKVTWYA